MKNLYGGNMEARRPAFPAASLLWKCPTTKARKKNGATDLLPDGPTHRRGRQHECSCESQCRPDTVGYGVRNDVAQPVFLDHRKNEDLLLRIANGLRQQNPLV
ncbi:MAG: hypothetical protein WAM71_14635 [Candidatus Korobacteraceae bacterium]